MSDTAIAERLRRVREMRDVPNLTEFHRRLTGKDYQISYDAVRTYDQGREPPPSFLARVAEVFDVRLEWLVAGKEPPTEADEEVAAVSEGAARGDEGPTVAERKYLRALKAKRDAWRGLGLPWPERAPELPGDDGEDRELTPEETVDYLGARFAHVNLAHIPHWVPALAEVRRRYGHATIDEEQLARALRAALDALGIDPVAAVGRIYDVENWLDDFVTGMVPVLLALAPERSRQRANKEATDAE